MLRRDISKGPYRNSAQRIRWILDNCKQWSTENHIDSALGHRINSYRRNPRDGSRAFQKNLVSCVFSPPDPITESLNFFKPVQPATVPRVRTAGLSHLSQSISGRTSAPRLPQAQRGSRLDSPKEIPAILCPASSHATKVSRKWR
jgi:hypothetical protein